MALIAGAIVSLITYALSNTDISGPGWSLRGNGSLVVLFAGAGALLAFGWLALAFGARSERGWLNKALLGAAAAAVLEIAFVAIPIALGAESALPILLPLIVVTLALALGAGLLLAQGGYTQGATIAILALAFSLAPLGLHFFIVPLFIPVLIGAPALSRALNAWLIANSVALLVALLIGIYVAQTVLNR